MTHLTWTSKAARAAALAAVLVLLPGASPAPGPEETLAAGLRQLYGGSVQPWERWRRRSAVRLPDGREVPREEAYRDDPAFVPAARRLLASRAGDDAPLGAWLLGTLPEARRPEAEPALVEALAHRDERAAFEAAQALAQVGGPESLDRAAAGRRGRLLGGGAGRVGLRRGRDPPEDRGPRSRAPAPGLDRLAPTPARSSRPGSDAACPGG